MRRLMVLVVAFSLICTGSARAGRGLEKVLAGLEAFSQAVAGAQNPGAAPADTHGADDAGVAVVDAPPGSTAPAPTPADTPGADDDGVAVVDAPPGSTARAPTPTLPPPAEDQGWTEAPAYKPSPPTPPRHPVETIVSKSEPKVVNVRTERVQKADGSWVIRTTTTLKRDIVTRTTH